MPKPKIDLDPIAVSVPQAGALIDVSEKTAWKLVAAGLIPSVKWFGRVIVPVDGLRSAVEKAAAANLLPDLREAS